MSLPYNETAERALLGGLMTAVRGTDEAMAVLTAEDFSPGWRQALFVTLSTMRRRGDSTNDTVLVLDEIRKTGLQIEPNDVITVLAEGSPGGLVRLADTLVRCSVARKVLIAAEALVAEARPGTMDATELVISAREAMAAIDAPLQAGAQLSGLSTVDDFLTTADTTPAPWIVPGLMRAGWRCLVVAPEGVGKSVTVRQVAIAAAQGVHPFTHKQIPPVRTLIVDLENPDDAIAETCRPITDRARNASARYDEGRAWLWRRPDGINLRSRADRAALERVIADTRPDLVALGPLYKAYRTTARESDELAGGEVQQVLDDLRTRYGFALLMEHHAPKGIGSSGGRDLVPYGSSLWLRWPELGLKLIPGDGESCSKDSLVVGRFRRDRMRNSWPDRLDRGGVGRWPWVGFWHGGMDEEPDL